MKPDCYECKWRRDIPGSCHSNCQHPLLAAANENPMLQMLGMFASVGRIPPIQAGIDKLGIKANYHGVKMGWFNFPFNFDPIWLENCDGFEEKEVKDESEEHTD
jgi:hypothetical protein